MGLERRGCVVQLRPTDAIWQWEEPMDKAKPFDDAQFGSRADLLAGSKAIGTPGTTAFGRHVAAAREAERRDPKTLGRGSYSVTEGYPANGGVQLISRTFSALQRIKV
jgi:hypothetical protein